jgi:hypothetical protein
VVLVVVVMVARGVVSGGGEGGEEGGGKEVRAVVVEVVVEVARAVALARCCIWRCDCRLSRPYQGGAGENGRESRPPPRRVVTDVIVVIAANRGRDRRIAAIRRRHVNMLRNKSVLLKLENIIVFTMYSLASLRHNASMIHCA